MTAIFSCILFSFFFALRIEMGGLSFFVLEALMVDDEEFVAVADETSILLVNWINKEERDLDDDGSHDSRRSHN